MIYLDNSATTKIDDEVKQIIIEAMDKYGNPSSNNSIGIEAKNTLEQCRQRVAKCFNCEAKNIIFTSGSTEGNNTVINHIVNTIENPYIWTSSIEHKSILKPCNELYKKNKINYGVIPVNNKGIVDIEFIKNNCINSDLICVMYVNNVIGVVNNIEKVSEIIHSSPKTKILCDATQSIGYCDIDVQKLGVDFLTCSGHKFHAPKGIGILYVKDTEKFLPFLQGGGQEKGLRGGTENLPYIIGVTRALELAVQRKKQQCKEISELSSYVKNVILKSKIGAILNGDELQRVPYNLNFSFEGVNAQALMLYLDSKGIMVSTGSACTSHETQTDYVLDAIGASKFGGIRITLSHYTTKEECTELVKNIIQGVNFLRLIL